MAAAEALYRTALAQAPNHPSILSNLADVILRQGRGDEGVALYERAIAADPSLPEPRNNLGSILNDMGKPEAALAHLEQAVRLRPQWPEALCNLAAAYGRLGRTGDAIAAAAQAAALAPGFARAHYNLGTALAHDGRHDQALSAFAAACAHQPNYAEAMNGIGVSALALGDPATAAEALENAARLSPNVAEIHNNLGNALKAVDRLDAAESACRRAIALAPAYPDAHNSLGSILTGLGRHDQAEQAFAQAVRLHPAYAEAHANLGMTLLRRGAYAEGWKEYEHRWQANKLPFPRFGLPLWRGEDAAPGATLLLYAEQGFGDTMQFIRFAAPIAARGMRVVVEVPAPLVELVRSAPGVAQAIAIGELPPAADYQLPMMSAPHALGETRLDGGPYLRADPARVAAWGRRLAELTGPRIGLVWAGNSALGLSKGGLVDKHRSLSLEMLAPLLSVPGCSFVSLQLGQSADSVLNGGVLNGRIVDWTGDLTDFSETAALIEGLDLVIAVDTSVAHLAGALGKPVWVLSRFDGCWRWLISGDASPWYASLRLYRQASRGRWDEVIARVRDDLQAFTTRFGPTPDIPS